MKLLLDTHALLWWFTDDVRLSNAAREAIADERNEIFVSAASAWEIATKQRIGKLDEVPEAAGRFAELVAADGFTHLPIGHGQGLTGRRIAIRSTECWHRKANWMDWYW